MLTVIRIALRYACRRLYTYSIRHRMHCIVERMECRDLHISNIFRMAKSRVSGSRDSGDLGPKSRVWRPPNRGFGDPKSGVRRPISGPQMGPSTETSDHGSNVLVPLDHGCRRENRESNRLVTYWRPLRDLILAPPNRGLDRGYGERIFGVMNRPNRSFANSQIADFGIPGIPISGPKWTPKWSPFWRPPETLVTYWFP